MLDDRNPVGLCAGEQCPARDRRRLHTGCRRRARVALHSVARAWSPRLLIAPATEAISTAEPVAEALSEQRVLRLLLVAVSVALIWVLLPFYGSVLWGAIIALLFRPLYRWLLPRLRERRRLRSCCAAFSESDGGKLASTRGPASSSCTRARDGSMWRNSSFSVSGFRLWCESRPSAQAAVSATTWRSSAACRRSKPR